MRPQDPSKSKESEDRRFSAPAVPVPTGGGAIKGIGEKFAANPVTGTAALTIPLPLSPGRSGFTPPLALSYDSGAGSGPYGFGWNVGYAAITRRTDRGLPRYADAAQPDVFILSGADDLVPVTLADGTPMEEERDQYRVTRYRPRIEGLFARIERWTHLTDASDIFWRSISRDNVTSLYGKTAASRIADPRSASRIFSWLLCESFDDKGSAAVYEYVAEDGANVDVRLPSESNRSDSDRTANRYLKRVKYGNRTSKLIEPDLAGMDWLFELVMDYGDHEGDAPGINPSRAWPVRPDPFCSCRAGFEVRTSRRCHRVLMFHRFAELGPEPRLVRSLELDYDDFDYPPGFDTRGELEHAGSTRAGSLLRRATAVGYADGGLRAAMPPLEFTYSRPRVGEEARTLADDSYVNLPAGVDGTEYQWLDLYRNGLAGVLSEQSRAWWFKPNLGDGRLGPQQLVSQAPSFGLDSRTQFLDLEGRSQLDLVQLKPPNAGYFERDEEDGWSGFTPFLRQPAVDWNDRNLRLVDLTGAGHADILITEDEVIHWYPSLGDDGFGPRETVRLPPDEAAGPRVIFQDVAEAIFLADMSGDGLSDLVRIRNAEICYWPNLGYGRFGAKVTMDGAPILDAPGLFESRRIRLADIDGSGTVDLIYLGAAVVRLYFNRSGNGWTAPLALASFPPVDNVANVSVTDLLGNGTACLVWSSALPSYVRAPLNFVDLMGNRKPHLLIGVENNLGARTAIEYAASTRFFLADQQAGRPWITRLPFPVHVVARTELHDDISRNRFVTRYTYHHGYFDGAEREFRGFGMVEQTDTEEFAALDAGQQMPPATNVDRSSHVPPVLTRSWFHTGVFLGRGRVSGFFAGLLSETDPGEYYREPGSTDSQAEALLLEDTTLPPDLTADEEREACRALKGALLRQEIYALDGTGNQPHPYSISEQNFTVRMLQPKGVNPHAVFLAHPRESLGYHYERHPADPRVSHELKLEVDDFGNVLKSATVAYGRRQPDPALEPRDQARQGELHIVYAENDVTNDVQGADTYRAPLPSESRRYEVTGLPLPPGRARFTVDQVREAIRDAPEISFEQSPAGAVPQRRLVAKLRTLYRRDDLTAALLPGRLESLGLPFETYQLALTRGLISAVLGDRFTDAVLTDEGRYVHGGDDLDWWIPSGRVFHSPASADDAAAELANARRHFFLPSRYRDPFAQTSFVTFDQYDLLIAQTRDPLANLMTVGERDGNGQLVRAGQDYRVLRPFLVTDPNGNRTAASFDAMGMVAGTAVMGKRDEVPRRGDSLEGFLPDLPEAVVATHVSDPLTDPLSVLARASTRVIHDVWAYHRSKQQPQPSPAVSYALVRETHDADLASGEQTRVQHTFSYSDGFGREIQKKTRAVTRGMPTWIGSGWTVFNNKGNPVRQFEPFFTGTQAFEADVRIGVSPILCYDPVGRVVATVLPDHTWEKVTFDSWRQESWDANDTVVVADPSADPAVGDFFRRLPAADYLPTWHAQRQAGALGPEQQDAAAKATSHAATPTIAHADSLGRPFLTIAHNRVRPREAPPADPPIEEHYTTRVVLDIEGNQLEAVDALDRTVVRYDYDLLGTRIHQVSMEAGERWVLGDAAARPIRADDTRGHRFRTEYDELGRPLRSFVRGSDPQNPASEILYARTEYGEGQPDDLARNLRLKPCRQFDGAGMVANESYDFKGNLLLARRTFALDYKDSLDWSASPGLEAEAFTASTAYDALNRPIRLTSPDASVYRSTFDDGGMLEKVDVTLPGAQTTTAFVTNIDYDAKGQRQLVEYGNSVRTAYTYDALTLRLTGLQTTRAADQAVLQERQYAFDPVGNITRIRDGATQTIYFDNQPVTADNDYVYDALYRLIAATGREHIGQGAQPQTTWDDEFRVHLPHPGDEQAMRRYTEDYRYDAANNFLQLVHSATNGNWTRAFGYDEPSPLEPGKRNNRLSRTTVGANAPELHLYDAHGNITAMAHLSSMDWNFRDQLCAISRQVVTAGVPESTYYVYDAAGERVRKVTERSDGTRKNDRRYLGWTETYREFGSGGTSVTLERATLHVKDGPQRLALVETRLQGSEPGIPARLIRYQFGNHLGTVGLELNEQAQVISYEEYTPFGSTSYQAGPGAVEVSRKRYRYTGMERDEESGLFYQSARYYVPWSGRWLSPDPIGTSAGLNLYCYCGNEPIAHSDPSGLDTGKERTAAVTKRVEEFFSFADRNSDHHITVAEFNTGLSCSTVSASDIEIYGPGARGAYTFDFALEGRISFNPPIDYAKAYERSENANQLTSSGYMYTNRTGREATKRSLNRHRDPQRVIVTAKVAAMVLVPEYYLVSKSIYHSATGDPKAAVGALVELGVGKLVQGATGGKGVVEQAVKRETAVAEKATQAAKPTGTAIIKYRPNEDGSAHFTVEVKTTTTSRETHQITGGRRGSETYVVEVETGTFSKSPVPTRSFELPKAEAALQSQADQIQWGDMGQWYRTGPNANSCATHVTTVVSKGGGAVPPNPADASNFLYQLFGITRP